MNKLSLVLFIMFMKVDSRFRSSGTPEDYVIRMKVPVKNVGRMVLKSVNMPKSMYPVIAGWNDVIDYDIGGGATTRTITSGRNYTGAQLAAELTTQLAAGPITYSSNTGKLTFGTTPATLLLEQTTTPAFAYVLGYEPGSGSIAQPTGQVDLTYPRWLRLAVDVNNLDVGGQCQDTTKQFSYNFQFNNSQWGEIESWTQDETYVQRDPISDINVQDIHVKWTMPDDALALDLEGIDHQIVFQVFGV